MDVNVIMEDAMREKEISSILENQKSQDGPWVAIDFDISLLKDNDDDNSFALTFWYKDKLIYMSFRKGQKGIKSLFQRAKAAEGIAKAHLSSCKYIFYTWTYCERKAQTGLLSKKCVHNLPFEPYKGELIPYIKTSAFASMACILDYYGIFC